MNVLSEAAIAMNGTLIGSDLSYKRVSTDSRDINAGDLFVALKGENFNGEGFVSIAIEAGAAAVVLSEQQNALSVPQIVVTDTTQAYGLLAKQKRRVMKAKVIAITGSCGKTSVKGMLKNILELKGKTVATHANFNNHIGVPKTILAAANDAEFLIVEAGTSAKGEIAYLAQIIEADVAVVSNVHAAHIEGFGSIDAISLEKSDMFLDFGQAPVCIVNSRLLKFDAFKKKSETSKCIVFDCDSPASNSRSLVQVSANNTLLNTVSCAEFDLNLNQTCAQVQLNVPGLHQIENALSAAACAMALNIDIKLIKQGLESYSGEQGRMQALPASKGLLIDDTYNANPASMRAAIDYLSTQKSSILILGDMAELGEFTEQEHKKIGVYAADKGIHSVLCIGKQSAQYNAGFNGRAHVFLEVETLLECAKNLMNENTTILVKGSRSSKMDKVSHALKAVEE